jgi:hypothetical protein
MDSELDEKVTVFDSPIKQTFILSLPRPDRFWDEMKRGGDVMVAE